ncbi:SpdD protein [Streptomyces sp. NPDC007063]|uniref:SpdD protein n=1 Tax=Streptomyces sp. NPDC007063 TaxID=3364772 RepID=UPI0036839E36
MLFRPQLPPEPTSHLPATTPQHAHPTACACQHTLAPAPTASARPALPSVGAGAVAVVIVGGVVLTVLLAAVVVSAISVAVAAVVLRSLLANASRR